MSRNKFPLRNVSIVNMKTAIITKALILRILPRVCKRTLPKVEEDKTKSCFGIVSTERSERKP